MQPAPESSLSISDGLQPESQARVKLNDDPTQLKVFIIVEGQIKMKDCPDAFADDFRLSNWHNNTTSRTLGSRQHLQDDTAAHYRHWSQPPVIARYLTW